VKTDAIGDPHGSRGIGRGVALDMHRIEHVEHFVLGIRGLAREHTGGGGLGRSLLRSVEVLADYVEKQTILHKGISDACSRT